VADVNDGRASFGRLAAAAAAAATAGYFTFALSAAVLGQLAEITSATSVVDVAADVFKGIAIGFGIALIGIVFLVGLFYWLVAWLAALAVEAVLTRLGVRRRQTTVAIGAVVGAVVGTLLLGGFDFSLPLRSVAGALSGAASAAASWGVIHSRKRS